MSALRMILMAGLAVGCGAEKLPTRFDGVWEGRWDEIAGDSATVRLSDGWISVVREHSLIEWGGLKIDEEGAGKLRFDIEATASDEEGDRIRLGIYKWDADCLIICLGKNGGSRPKTFHGGNGQALLTLHRVKPRK